MGLLDDIEEYKPIAKPKLHTEASLLVGRRKTRRGKKVKKPKNAKWTKEFKQAMKDHYKMKEDFERLIK